MIGTTRNLTWIDPKKDLSLETFLLIKSSSNIFLKIILQQQQGKRSAQNQVVRIKKGIPMNHMATPTNVLPRTLMGKHADERIKIERIIDFMLMLNMQTLLNWTQDNYILCGILILAEILIWNKNYECNLSPFSKWFCVIQTVRQGTLNRGRFCITKRYFNFVIFWNSKWHNF